VSHVTTPRSHDVVVIGGGLVGLASALAMADQGIRVAVIDDGRPGQASRASGGVLAPSIDPAPGAAGTAALAALARYPAFLDALHERTGHRIRLGRGVLQVAGDEAEADRLRAAAGERPGADARWLPAAEAREIEPALGAPHGALLHRRDGWVDARALLAALEQAVAGARPVTIVRGAAIAVRPHGDEVRVSLADGTHVGGRRLVLAAGAWAPLVVGLGRAAAVRPLRGQMLELDQAVVRHVVFGGGGYLVPGDAGTLVGATSEPVGFDAGTTASAADELRGVLTALAPTRARAPVARQWAGLRPMTADGQPLVGPDGERSPILYACGHSRNGVLLAALTADCVTALVVGAEPPVDIRPFAPGRFDDPAGTSTGKNAFEG
jgi:glycine oxidase